jgi:aspartyl-tRNA(Asn)/glutamyl-tRNA(Gln) amidotransferase subunit B
MNSFRNVQRALDYEIRRQKAVLESGGQVVQETRLWDDARSATLTMRTKEEAHDYRYFPDPDLVPVAVEKDWIEAVRSTLPELPDAKKRRFLEDYDLPEYDARILTASKPLANYFEAAAKAFPQPKTVSNWIMSELMRELKRDECDIEDCPVSPDNLAELLELLNSGTISGKIAKTVFEEMYTTGKRAKAVVEEKGLVQVTDESAIESVVDEVLSENTKEVEAYRNGKQKLWGFFVGQVMKKTKGKANPKIVNEILRSKLS